MPLNPVSMRTVQLTFSGAQPMPQHSLVGAITRLSSTQLWVGRIRAEGLRID